VRRRWFEFNERAKAYQERFYAKWVNFGRPYWMLRLPRNFTCYWYRKDVPIWEILHRCLVETLGKTNGQFEYDMLEIERITLRKVLGEKALKMRAKRMAERMCRKLAASFVKEVVLRCP